MNSHFGISPVIVFDLDGCLSRNPYEDDRLGYSHPDSDMWTTHWQDQSLACHEELIEMARAMLAGGHRVLVLTGRPTTFANDTIRWLKHLGPWSVVYHNDGQMYGADDHPVIDLIMVPAREDGALPSSTAQWKKAVIERLMSRGVNIRLLVEDFKPNADVIREVVPVLLYERQKKVLFTESHPATPAYHAADVPLT